MYCFCEWKQSTCKCHSDSSCFKGWSSMYMLKVGWFDSGDFHFHIFEYHHFCFPIIDFPVFSLQSLPPVIKVGLKRIRFVNWVFLPMEKFVVKNVVTGSYNDYAVLVQLISTVLDGTSLIFHSVWTLLTLANLSKRYKGSKLCRLNWLLLITT